MVMLVFFLSPLAITSLENSGTAFVFSWLHDIDGFHSVFDQQVKQVVSQLC